MRDMSYHGGRSRPERGIPCCHLPSHFFDRSKEPVLISFVHPLHPENCQRYDDESRSFPRASAHPGAPTRHSLASETEPLIFDREAPRASAHALRRLLPLPYHHRHSLHSVILELSRVVLRSLVSSYSGASCFVIPSDSECGDPRSRIS